MKTAQTQATMCRDENIQYVDLKQVTAQGYTYTNR